MEHYSKYANYSFALLNATFSLSVTNKSKWNWNFTFSAGISISYYFQW